MKIELDTEFSREGREGNDGILMLSSRTFAAFARNMPFRR